MASRAWCCTPRPTGARCTRSWASRRRTRCGTRGMSSEAHPPGVRAVGGEAPGIGVSQLALEDGVEPLLRCGVVHGGDHLDASPQVAGSPVGRADVVLGGSPVLEIIDARVLEEATQ